MSSPLSIARRAIRQAQTRLAYRTVFDTEDGRRVLHDLLREAGVLDTSLVPGDPQGTAFNEGRRALALHIIQTLRWSEGELVQLARMRTAEQLQTEED